MVGDFLQELRRRNVVRVGVAYLIVSWIVVQIVETISDPLGDEVEDVTAPFDGIVIGRSNLPLAHEGDALFNLSSFADVPKAGDVVEIFASAHQVELGDA